MVRGGSNPARFKAVAKKNINIFAVQEKVENDSIEFGPHTYKKGPRVNRKTTKKRIS